MTTLGGTAARCRVARFNQISEHPDECTPSPGGRGRLFTLHPARSIPSAAQVLQTALSGFGHTVTTLGGFGGTVAINGGFNQIQTSALSNVTITGGTNSYAQALDPNAASVLNTVIGGFGHTVGSLGGFGNSVTTLGGFGGSLSITGGLTQVATSVLTSVNVSGGTTS